MKDYFTLETMHRVVSEDSRPHVQAIKDGNTLRYDIHIDDAPMTPSIKAAVFSIFKDMLQFLPPQMAQIYLPHFLEWSPLPGALVEKLVAASQKAAQPKPQQLLATAIELRKTYFEGSRAGADAVLKHAKADAESEKVDQKDDANKIAAMDSVINLLQTQIQNQTREVGNAG